MIICVTHQLSPHAACLVTDKEAVMELSYVPRIEDNQTTVTITVFDIITNLDILDNILMLIFMAPAIIINCL